jgi:hypothetical protein
LDVLIAQNLHPLVHVSPINCTPHQHHPSNPELCTYHDGSGSVSLVPSPTLPDIRTPRLLTHSVQSQSPQILLDLVVRCRDRDFRLEVRREPRSATPPQREYRDPVLTREDWTHCFDLVKTRRAGSVGRSPGARKSSSASPWARRASRRGRETMEEVDAAVARDLSWCDSRRCSRVV